MDLQEQLLAGNSRANRDRIARWIGTDRVRFGQIMRIYLEGDTREAQLAAGVLFSCLEFHPRLITPWLPRIVARMSAGDSHPAVRRVAVRILMDAAIPRKLQGRVVKQCYGYLTDTSEPIAIRVFAMGTIARIAETEPDLWNELLRTIEHYLPYSTPAVRAHARKVYKRAGRHLSPEPGPYDR
jgi:hypothetical protein